MVILHTSDWHIGRVLYGRRRYEEHDAFFCWLAEAVEKEGADVLLVSGDVFDNGTPSNRAQEIYYRFLDKMAASRCRHVVITGGNHDSPTFLDAPRDLLRGLYIHIVGAVTGKAADEVLVLRDSTGAPSVIVCAVPYLRDRDVRLSEAGESYEDKERKMTQGIYAHYAAVCALAQERRVELGGEVPVVAMGHLFAAGGQTVEGDGVRDLYVGSLAQVDAGAFPQTIDYLALGHLHILQRIQGNDNRLYSGSPLPMGFGEAGQQKCIVRIDFLGRTPSVSLVPIPTFQMLERVSGGWETIERRLNALVACDSDAWLEVTYDGAELAGTLRERLEGLIAGTKMSMLRIRNLRVMEKALEGSGPEETLDDLEPEDVFERCLEVHEVAEDQREQLRLSHKAILQSMLEEDVQAL